MDGATLSIGRGQVVVVGSGVAGLAAAYALALRGERVLVVEAHPKFFGGRTMALEDTTFEHDGRAYAFALDHGQHCVWSQYHSMRWLLDEIGLLAKLIPCEGTQFILDDGARTRRTPRLNTDPRRPHASFPHFLFHLAQATGVFGLPPKDLVKFAINAPKLLLAAAFQHENDYEAWDNVSIASYFTWAGLPVGMQDIAQALQRASTFHDAKQMSAAWGLSMIQTTMLGSVDDHKKWCFPSSLGTSLIDPIVERLRTMGVRFALNTTACGVELSDGRVHAVKIRPTSETCVVTELTDAERDDGIVRVSAVVSACDIPGFRRFLLPDLAHVPEIRAVNRLETVHNVTVRVFTTRKLSPSEAWLGIFVGGRFKVLDDYFLISRYQTDFTGWEGDVIELHSYFAANELDPTNVPMETIRKIVHDELVVAWPELDGHVAHIHVHANPKTFDKQSIGASQFQPRMKTSVRGLYLCGSWVRTTEAIHDMEKGVRTGFQAANCVLEELGRAPITVQQNHPPSNVQKAAQVVGRFVPTPPGVRSRRARRAEIALRATES